MMLLEVRIRVYRVVFVLCVVTLPLSYACPRICDCGYHEGAHTLDCGSQGLTDVVSNIPEWTTLMDLDGNELATLDLNFCSVCIYFEQLSLRYNRIERILTQSNRTDARVNNAAFCGKITDLFPRLWSVNLRGNLLRVLPKCLLHVWPSLKYLNLNENMFRSMRNLNLISYAPQTHSLEELHLQDNKISQLLKTDLYSSAIAVRKLRVLNLSRNRVHTVESGVLAFFDGLVNLDLSSNKIGFLPDFAFVTKGEALETVKLNNNYIGWISIATFAGLPNLRTLDLQNNEIGCIMPKFWSTCQLSSLTYDPDQALPVNPSTKHFHRRFKHNFGSLRTVEILPNPWVCDCKLLGLFSNTSALTVISSLPSLHCSTPLNHEGEPAREVVESLTCS